MNINSEYIQKKEFHTAFKGYSMEEVDKFLDILAVEFERITKKNMELQDSLDKVKYEGEIKEESDMNTLVSEVLVSAHKVADEIKKKAEADAKEIIQNKKEIEENQLKELLKEKKLLEEKVKFIEKYYGDFILKVKKDIGDFNSKIAYIEDGFKIENISEEQDSVESDTQKTETDYDQSSLQENSIISEEKQVFETSDEETSHSDDEEIKDNNISPEIVRLANEEEEKKIREVIESKDIEENNDGNTARDTKREKKIFNEYEEDMVVKERKKIDIGNPDIINEFFGNNDERKY
ncbi:MAG: DivIVA domain-containing protein [Candidatus Humimicrobiaceae bacterium]